MKFNGWNSFEDMARACGYTTNDDNEESSGNSNSTNNMGMGCGDIPNGFQALSPELFVIVGEILGNIIAGNVPFNVQNALGNWLELVGQVILTYNTQQQYFQGGPGRYYNPMYYNVDNSFCSNNSDAQNNSNSKSSNNKNSNENSEKTSNSNYYDDKFIKSQISKIQGLELQVHDIMSEIDRIKSFILKGE